MNSKPAYKLDTDKYFIIGQREAAGLPVILQCSREPPTHYCVQYAGNGAYFDTKAEAMLYMHDRWGQDIIGKPRTVWEPVKPRPVGEN